MSVTKLTFDDSPKGVAAFGVYSSFNASRFCYELNNLLDLELVKAGKDYTSKVEGTVVEFLSFEFFNSNKGLLWQLVKNKRHMAATPNNENELYATEKSPRWLRCKSLYDYIFWVETEEEISACQKYINENLRNMPFVQTFEFLPLTLTNQIIKQSQG